jgi:hypothetical protein
LACVTVLNNGFFEVEGGMFSRSEIFADDIVFMSND